MLVEFNEISDASRLWVFQIDRAISREEEEKFMNGCRAFLAQWAAHGSGMTASALLHKGRILLIAADESQVGASGCSIDSLTQDLKSLQSSLGFDLFNRQIIFYEEEGELKELAMMEFKDKVVQGEIGMDTLMYNTTISMKRDMENSFLIPIKDSWLTRLLPTS